MTGNKSLKQKSEEGAGSIELGDVVLEGLERVSYKGWHVKPM